jgi:general secretion pathway protein H
MSATGRPGEAGSTLVEMLVVVGILGLIAGLAYPAARGAVERSQLERARADLVSNLRLARASAAREGHEIRVDLAPDGAAYAWEQTAVTLPATVHAAGDPGVVKFYVDGTSSGGAWEVRAHARALGVSVDPVTGVAAPTGAGRHG